MVTIAWSIAAMTAPVAGASDGEDAIRAGAVDALDRIEQAAERLGGAESLRSLERLEYRFDGPARFPYQGPDPDTPDDVRYRSHARIDLAARQVELLTGFTAGPSMFERQRFIDGDPAAYARVLRYSPHAVVSTFLGAPAELVALNGESGYSVVAGPLGGELLMVWIERDTGRIDRIAWHIDDLEAGNATARARFSEWRQHGDWSVPGRIELTEAGKTIFDLAFDRYELGDTAAVVEAPDESGSGGEAPPPSRGRPDAPERELGDGVIALFDTGGPDYHSMVVTTPAGPVLIEAPGSIRDGIASAARVEERLGASPVAVAATHHHGDHSGGFAGAVRVAGTGIVSDAHAAFFRTMATAPRDFSGLAFEPPDDIELLTVPASGSRGLFDRIEAHDVGNDHSAQHLVFFVPDAGVLFQSDMLVFHWDGSVEAARDQGCLLRDYIRDNGLDVHTIVGGHGAPGGLEQLDAAVEQRGSPCPAE